MTYKGPPQHAGEFIAAMKYAEARLGKPYKGKYFEYTQVKSSKSIRARSGTWYYIDRADGPVSWFASRYVITQVVGPKGQWNPQATKSQRHECGHLILHAHKVPVSQHHEILRKAGLDYVRN